jgi:hypothetical protein
VAPNNAKLLVKLTTCAVLIVMAVVVPLVFSTNAPVVSPVDTSAVPLVVPAEIELMFYPQNTT